MPSTHGFGSPVTADLGFSDLEVDQRLVYSRGLRRPVEVVDKTAGQQTAHGDQQHTLEPRPALTKGDAVVVEVAESGWTDEQGHRMSAGGAGYTAT